jgi:hypothetical protein
LRYYLWFYQTRKTAYPPVDDITKVGINLTQLQGLVAFRDLQNKFSDTDNNFIDYVEKKSKKSKN